MDDAIGHSTQFQRSDDGTAGGVFTSVGTIRDISAPGLSRDVVETTHMLSTDRWREFIGGMRDGGEMSFTLTFDPDAAETTSFETDLNADTKAYYKIIWPDADEWGFFGWLTAFNVSAPVEDKMEAEVTIKITGKPGWIA